MNEERREGETVVRLEGELTIQRAGELRQALLRAGESSARVSMEFEDFEGADLSFMQLVCAAHQESVRSGWSLSWGPSVPEAFLKSAEGYGFCRGRGCARDKDGSCMWKALKGRHTYSDNTLEQCAVSACAGREQ